MRVLHYVDSVAPELGGITSAVRSLATVQTAVGAHVSVVVRQADVSPRQTDGAQGEGGLVRLGGRTYPGAALDRPGLRRLRALVAESDVVHVHTLWSVGTAQIANLCAHLQKPLCISLHGALGDWPLQHKRLKKAAFLATAGRWTLRRAAMLHATCEAEAVTAQSRLRGLDTACQVVPLPLDAQSYAMAAADAQGFQQSWTPTVVFLGRLHRIKRLDRVIDAVALVARRCDAVRLVVAGSGTPEEIKNIRRHTAQAGIADRVEMRGFVAGKSKLRLLASSAVLVLASEHENYGLVSFEALAAGTPVIVVPTILSASELAASGGALISDPYPAALACAMESLLIEESSRRMGSAGRRWLRDNLDPTDLGARSLRMYRSAMERLDDSTPVGASSQGARDAVTEDARGKWRTGCHG